MSLDCRSLPAGDYARIHRAFQAAFADYAMDSSAMTEGTLRDRAIKNGIDFDASAGVFDGDEIVGFTLVGIDDWKGGRGAFDIATGIVPCHRGKGLARRMFDHALPVLREKGVDRFVLEVLKENEAAFRAYEKSGFRIVRDFECFQITPDNIFVIKEDSIVETRSADRSLLDRFEEDLDWMPSWENSFGSIRRIPDEVVVLTAGPAANPEGIAVLHPVTRWIHCLLVRRDRRRRGIGSALLGALAKAGTDSPAGLKAINVDASDRGSLAFFRNRGFEPYASQFEMERPL